MRSWRWRCGAPTPRWPTSCTTTGSCSGFRRVVRKTVAKLDSRSPKEKTTARRSRLGARCLPQPDGLVTVAATMPAADGQRRHGERQIDVLRDLMHGTGTTTTATAGDSAASGRPSRRLELQVVIDWRSLLGLRDDPAELLGYGPITATDVRAMLGDPGTTLRRLVTDPVTGVLIDYGTTRYRPDPHLSGLTKARDVTCRYPGCTRNARYCDDEHCHPYPRGTTSAGNICQLCRTHHRRKTRGRFTYTRPRQHPPPRRRRHRPHRAPVDPAHPRRRPATVLALGLGRPRGEVFHHVVDAVDHALPSELGSALARGLAHRLDVDDAVQNVLHFKGERLCCGRP